MAYDNEPVESDLRRRAAWLLAMLGVVAVLLIVVMTTLIGSDKGPNKPSDNAGPLDGALTSPHPASATHHTPSAVGEHRSTASTTPVTATRTTAGAHAASCPSPSRCALPDDIGNAIAAVNIYRTQHGQPAVPGAVSPAAQACALDNGTRCTGNWAESRVPGPDGAIAVAKLTSFAHLLDPQLRSFGVGWAYDPGSKQYFFSIVRNG